MKKMTLIAASILAATAFAAVPLKWTVETSDLDPVSFNVIRGESLALEATFLSYGTALDMGSDPCCIFWQTNGMNRSWWIAPASVIKATGSTVSNVVKATFSPSMDPGANVVNGFLGSTGEIYRAAFTLRFRNGPGATPNELPLPAKVIDCEKVTFLHPEAAPFSGGGGGGLQTNAVIRIAANQVTNDVAPWALKPNTLPSGMTTNQVSGIITNHVTSGYLCTVAAAQAMTNGFVVGMSAAWTNGVAAVVTNDVGGFTEWTVGQVNERYGNSVTNVGVEWRSYRDGYMWKMHLRGYSSTLGEYVDEWLPCDEGDAIGLHNPATNYYATVIKESMAASSYITSTRQPLPKRNALGLAYLRDVPSTNGFVTAAVTNAVAAEVRTKANATDVYTKTVSDQKFASKVTVSEWETYWRGDRVRLSVTNYYGNTSGESPRLRIEEFDHSTTNGTVVSNFYHVVWDEIDRQTNYMYKTDEKVNNISNAVMDAAWKQTNLQLVNKAPRAWQSVTSAGEDAPPNTVWHTAPQSVFAGGTEYAHVAVGEGTICVLTDKGAPVYTDGAEGQFRFQDQSGQNYFGFDVRSAYKIGCRTDGISVNSQQHIVSLTYDLTSATNPSILHSTNLVDWADAVVEWEQNPPEGTKVCYINCGNDPKGFYQAEIRYAGGSKFLTNMQADLMGGIAASNQTLNVIQSVEPYIISNQVMWRVKQ